MLSDQTNTFLFYRVTRTFYSAALSSLAIGILLGGVVLMATLWKKILRADPRTCGFSLLIGAVCIAAALWLAAVNVDAAYGLLIIVGILLTITMPIVANILFVSINKHFCNKRIPVRWCVFFARYHGCRKRFTHLYTFH